MLAPSYGNPSGALTGPALAVTAGLFQASVELRLAPDKVQPGASDRMRWCGRTDRPVLPSARMKPARVVLTALVVVSPALAAAAPPPDLIFKDGFDAICGNEEIEPGEECDGSDLGAESCVSLGFVSGTLACTPACTFDTSACSNCGNGVADAGEDCDGADLGGQTCEDLGFASGSLSCSGACTYDTSACSNCGNGTIETGEACDGANLAGQTCQSQGFSGGTLACDVDCTSFDTTGCVP